MWSVAVTTVILIGGGGMEEFQFATELHRENTVRRVEALQQFQCKGKETVSMSVDKPVSEIHPSDILQP